MFINNEEELYMELKDNDLEGISGGFTTITPYTGGVKSGNERLYKVNEFSDEEKACLLENKLCKVDQSGNITEITDEAKAIGLLREKGFKENKIYASIMKK